VASGDAERLEAFIGSAKAGGVADAFIVDLLKQNGWSERRIYRAFSSYYERALGVAVPGRGERVEYANDAFMYLLAFLALTAWAFSLGYLFDALIDRWFPSSLDASYFAQSFRETVAGELATIIIAFPLFFFVSRSIIRGIAARPEAADSGVRKWLTYLALVVTAVALIGDGIWFLYAFLTGDLTIRFVLKALVLFAIAGAIFSYYLSTVRGPAVAGLRDRSYGAAAGGVVAIALVIGFLGIGTPQFERELAFDAARVADLRALATGLHDNFGTAEQPARPVTAPRSFAPAEISSADTTDPETHKGFEYRVLGGPFYELCATFDESDTDAADEPFTHPPGRTCFKLDIRKDY